MLKNILAITLCLTLNGILTQTASSQNPSFIPKVSPEKAAKRKSLPRKSTGKEVILPDVPRFPGASFVSCRDFAKAGSTVKSYNILYSIPKASESRVIPFYLGALGSWKILQQTNNTISARNKDTNTFCCITVGDFDGTYSNIEIDYSQGE